MTNLPKAFAAAFLWGLALGSLALDERARLPVGQPDNAPAAIVAQTKGISRSKAVAGDAYRGVLVAWSRAGDLPGYIHDGWWGEPEWNLIAPSIRVPIRRQSTGRDQAAWDPLFHGAVTVAGVKAGKYQLTAGPVSWPLEVVELPRRNKQEAVVDPGASVETVQKRVNEGYATIRLNPGLYRWNKPLDLSKAIGVVMLGLGAEIRYDGPRKEWVNLITGGEWVVLDGITFRGPDWVRPVEAYTAPNLTCIRCRFEDGCGLNQPGLGLYCEGCTFAGGGLFLGGDGGLLRRCQFVDSDADQYALSWGSDGTLAVVDCLWNRANRGLVLQPNWGDTNCALILGQTTLDTPFVYGGSEGGVLSEWGLLDEAGKPVYGIRNSLDLHKRHRSPGTAIQYDGIATGNLIRDVRVTEGPGIYLWSEFIKDNDFEDVKLYNEAGIWLSNGASNNRFTRGAVYGTTPADAVTWQVPPGAGNSFTSWTFETHSRARLCPDVALLAFTNATFNGTAVGRRP